MARQLRVEFFLRLPLGNNGWGGGLLAFYPQGKEHGYPLVSGT